MWFLQDFFHDWMVLYWRSTVVVKGFRGFTEKLRKTLPVVLSAVMLKGTESEIWKECEAAVIACLSIRPAIDRKERFCVTLSS